jgi:hypothetical protein
MPCHDKKILSELKGLRHDVKVLNMRDIEAHKFIDGMKKKRNT